MSQNFYLGPSFYFTRKKGKHLKTRAFKKNLRHCSRHPDRNSDNFQKHSFPHFNVIYIIR